MAEGGCPVLAMLGAEVAPDGSLRKKREIPSWVKWGALGALGYWLFKNLSPDTLISQGAIRLANDELSQRPLPHSTALVQIVKAAAAMEKAIADKQASFQNVGTGAVTADQIQQEKDALARLNDLTTQLGQVGDPVPDDLANQIQSAVAAAYNVINLIQQQVDTAVADQNKPIVPELPSMNTIILVGGAVVVAYLFYRDRGGSLLGEANLGAEGEAVPMPKKSKTGLLIALAAAAGAGLYWFSSRSSAPSTANQLPPYQPPGSTGTQPTPTPVPRPSPTPTESPTGSAVIAPDRMGDVDDDNGTLN